VGNAGGKTLSAFIGAFGAEALDLEFGTAGVIDLTAVTADTLEELAALINGYDHYSAVVLYGDNIPTQYILSQTVQAKGTACYILFTVTSVLNPYALATWERVKLFLLYNDADQLIGEYLINAATEVGEEISGRRIKAREYGPTASEPYLFDGTGQQRIILPDRPINSVSHLYVDPEGLFAAGTEILPTDYVLYKAAGIIALRNSIFPVGIQNVRAEYNGGLTPIMDRIQNAVVEIVSWNFKRFREAGGLIGIRSITTEGINTSMELDIPMSARRTFESLKG
jgi:hypothetical protein